MSLMRNTTTQFTDHKMRYECVFLNYFTFIILNFICDTKESIVYAAVGPFSSGQSRSLETFILDDDRVEYAQINYNIMAQNCTSDSVDETKFNAEGKKDDTILCQYF